MAAEQKPSIQERKRQLALSLDSSRVALSTSGRDLRETLNPLQAAKNCVQTHPLKVFGAVTAMTAWLSYRRRRRKEKPRKSRLRRFLIWGIALGKPLLRVWLVKQAKAYIQPKHVSPETDSLLGR